MLVNSFRTIHVDNKGLDSLLIQTGYPDHNHMDSEYWREFQNDVRYLLYEDFGYDIECELNGRTNRDLDIPKLATTNQEDEGWNDWYNYLAELEEEKYIDEALAEMYESNAWEYWASEQNRVEYPQGYKDFCESHRL